jgi:hypothetical protein
VVALLLEAAAMVLLLVGQEAVMALGADAAAAPILLSPLLGTTS